MEGRTLSHYRILEKIGAGGMGVVYRAHDERLDRFVALKVLPPGLLSDDAARRRFRREALALSKLNHPNIATIHDFDTQEGVDFLVMEYIPGQTLSEKLRSGPMPEKDVGALGAQIASALEGAHERGVVHRDLKPGNIIVTPRKQAKVLDFGLATLRRPEGELSQAETMSQAQAAVGTLPYMAPEQLRGETVDARSDIYAAGAVLYEMTTRQRPFPQESAPRLIDAIQHDAPATPSVINKRISSALDGIIMKALDKDPDRRYQSARELLVDLERLGAPVPLMVARRPQAWASWWVLAPGGALVVLVAVLAGMKMAGLRDRVLGRSGPQHIESLAVLPLENLSGDREQEYFADGMSDELITELAQIGALRVTSRTSTMKYRSTKKTLPEIGRELNVDAVVEGSVQRSGDQVRISAQLVHAATDRHLWAKSYQRSVRDLLSLQSEVAEDIAREIRVNLTPQERRRLVTVRPVSPEAHEAYLKGRYYWNKRTEEGVEKGIEYFRRAIEAQPDYGSAYAGLADSYVVLAGFDYLSPKDSYPQAKEAAMKALAIDDTLAEAHASLAMVLHGYDWDWMRAEGELNRSIQLNPSYQTAHHWLAVSLTTRGRFDEATSEFRRALELDPLSLIITAEAGFPALYARRYDEAIEQFRKAIQMDPYFPPAHGFLGLALEQQGRFPEAVGEFQKAMTLGGDTSFYWLPLGHAYALSGNRSEALRIVDRLKELSKRKYVSAFDLAAIYAALGSDDQAFESLEEAYRDRSGELVWINVDPRFDRLRTDPRFPDLLKRVGFSR